MGSRWCSVVVSVLAGAATPVVAIDTSIPAHGLPSASAFSETLLPEMQGVVSWKTFAQVEPVKQNAKVVPKFGQEVLALDARQVQVQGFIFRLDMGGRHFLISAVPASCPFCMPAGPEAIVEVFAKKSVDYGAEPIVVEGKLAVLRDDPYGMLYRLADAEVVATKVKYSRPKPVLPAQIWSWPEPVPASP